MVTLKKWTPRRPSRAEVDFAIETFKTRSKPVPEYKRVSDLIEDTLNPWPDLPKERMALFANQDVLLIDCAERRVRTDYPKPEDTDGKHQAMFVLFQKDPELPLQSTMLVSQDVLVDKLRQLKDGNAFPCLARFVPPKGPGGYWNVE